VLSSLGLPSGGPVPDPDRVLEAFRMDKKHRGAVRFVLLEDVGRARVVEGVPEDPIRDVLERMGSTP